MTPTNEKIKFYPPKKCKLSFLKVFLWSHCIDIISADYETITYEGTEYKFLWANKVNPEAILWSPYLAVSFRQLKDGRFIAVGKPWFYATKIDPVI